MREMAFVRQDRMATDRALWGCMSRLITMIATFLPTPYRRSVWKGVPTFEVICIVPYKVSALPQTRS